jgi:hypothetical protein
MKKSKAREKEQGASASLTAAIDLRACVQKSEALRLA